MIMRKALPAIISIFAFSSSALFFRFRGPFWSRFHGPKGYNVASEKETINEIPSQGPPLLWRYSGCGKGFSSVTLAEGKIFTAGDFAEREFVIALNLQGHPLWKSQNGKSWRRATPGSRSTPTYFEGVIYHLNPSGRLAAFQAKNGSELWSVDLKERFAARYGTWGMAESVLVTKKAVFCCPGGSKGAVVALDRRTGGTLWVNNEIEDRAAYSSPILIEHGEKKLLLALLERHLVALDPETGRTLWSFQHYTPYGVNVITPLYYNGCVFITGGYKTGSKLLKLARDGCSVKLVWFNPDLDNCHGGVILVNEFLYGSGCRKSKLGFLCVGWRTGKTFWKSPEIGKVSLVAAGNLLWAVKEKGEVLVIEANPEKCRILGRFRLPPGDNALCLAHPVLVDGILYIRRGRDLWAYRVGESLSSQKDG